MGSIFHWHPMAAKGRELLAEAGCNVNVSDAQIVIEHLQVAKKLGSPWLRCVGGNLFTRDEGHDMTALADTAVAILREASQAAEAMGMKIALENHADFTVRELASIQARVNSPAFGFTVDCANLAFDLDDPLRLARIMAPYGLTTHFKNYRVMRTPTGLALENCDLAGGEIDLVSIAQTLARCNPQIHLNIEIHSQFAPFKLDILEETYFQRHPAAAGRRAGLVPETVVDQAHARRAPGQSGRRPAVLGPRAGAPEGLGPLGKRSSASALPGWGLTRGNCPRRLYSRARIGRLSCCRSTEVLAMELTAVYIQVPEGYIAFVEELPATTRRERRSTRHAEPQRGRSTRPGSQPRTGGEVAGRSERFRKKPFALPMA